MMLVEKKKKKKVILTLIVGPYIAAMIYSSLVVPVIASVGCQDADTAYGYYPIWKIIPSTPSKPNSAAEVPITLKLNVTAWVLQYVFITVVFISLLLRTLKHFRD
ncbi:MAG: hypothetical protein JSV88_30570 [Candidatus Aminicenantes bacterium]|nr:MAG: hypothetical protein JSV88_30570 [Candidatus Aminicenantes bacterium]